VGPCIMCGGTVYNVMRRISRINFLIISRVGIKAGRIKIILDLIFVQRM
jgi:hypothetical protein